MSLASLRCLSSKAIMRQSSSEQLEPRETLNALISEHGFKEIVQELQNYALQNEQELGIPEKLEAYWSQVSGKLNQILEIEEVEDYEP